MRFIITICLILFILFGFQSRGAQPQDIRYERLTLKDGLLDYNIWAMCQDRYGFLWIGSSSGLQKFDGIHFTNFQNRASDTNSISSDFINCIFEDSKGRLWVGTEGGGLNYFVREKNIFIRYNKYKLESNWGLRIKSIAEDQHGNIWFGTQGGLYRLNPETRQFNLFNYDSLSKGSLSSNYIFALCFDPKTNSLYAGTQNGLNIYDEASDNFINQGNPNPQYPVCELLNSKYITNLFMGDTALWICTLNGGLFVYNRTTHQLKNMNEHFQFLSNKTYEKYYFVRDSKENLWISSYSEGIRKLNAASGNVEFIKADIKNKNGLASDWIITMFKDRNETLWICTNEGVNYFNLKRQLFEFNTILNHGSSYFYSIARGKSDEVWLGSRGSGLFCYHLNSGQTEMFLNNPNQKIAVTDIWDLYESAAGPIWIGANTGLIKLDPAKKTFEHYNIEYLDREGRKVHHVVGIFEDRKDTLWIITWNGQLMIFDRNKQKFFPAHHIPGLQRLKTIYSIASIIEDNKNQLWFGSNQEGLFRWNRTNGDFDHYNHEETDPASISSDQVFKIYESSDHSIWIGTMNNYLNKFDEKHNNFIRFGQQIGIPDASVQTIIEDDEKNLWLGTTKGLCLLNLKDSMVRTFDVFDGLPENNIYSDPIYLTEKRKIVFAASSSLVFFEPEKFKEQLLYSPVMITNIKLFDKFLMNAEAYGNEAHIDLNPKDNFVSIEFTALDYLHPNKIRYAYKLTGFNNDWVDNGDKRSVSFSNLAGGDYTLMVKSINADGVWSTPALLHIKKHPHLLQTNWFRILAALLIAALITTYLRLRVRVLRKQKIHLENMVELRTKQYKSEMERAERSEKFKEEFLANMSHEIRTPMNAVVGLSNLMYATNLNEKQKNYLNAIHESSVNLMVILNDILDLSKIEAGKIEFEEIGFSVRKVLKNVEDILSMKAGEKGMYLKTLVDPEIPHVILGDPTRLNQVLTNLVGNAIKFTEEGGITVSVEKKEISDEKLILFFRVSDTGIGIPADKQDKIFESFTQAGAETSRKFGGTGLGLSISKQLVELQGGTIGVKSLPGEGAEFYFEVPYKISMHPSDLLPAAELLLNPAEFNGVKILIVEDNAFNQMVAVDTLMGFNGKMHVEVAENGQTALNMVRRKKYDIILMDIQMPDMDGYEVTSKIRQSAEGINRLTPIIAMTANASKMEIEKCFAATMNEYISKPFEPNNLFQKISKVLVKLDF